MIIFFSLLYKTLADQRRRRTRKQDHINYNTSQNSMEILNLILLSLSFFIALKFLLPKLKSTSGSKLEAPLPPGPSTIPFFAKLIWERKYIHEVEEIIRDLHSKYGSVVALYFASHPTIFVNDRRLAHQALINMGTTFADRPPVVEPEYTLSCNRHEVNSSSYGPLWRLFRRNMSSTILHSSRVKLFAHARDWSLQVLFDDLRSQVDANKDGTVVVTESFQLAISCLLLYMCFGQKLDLKDTKDVDANMRFLLYLNFKFNVFGFFPKITKVLFRQRWNEIMRARQVQAEVFLPIIRERHERKRRESGGEKFLAYADSFADIRLPEEGGRKLREEEMVTLCHEFLSAGTDTTATTLEWLMAELVNHQDIQQKLVEEIRSVVADEEEIKEEDLQKMPYLKATVLEGLRRHPAGHFGLPHFTVEDSVLNGYLIPKGSEVHFFVAEIGWDEEVWEDPMAFKPERFLKPDVVDLTGSREIKMMPFGVGRRICPGMGLALLHLEFFVANMVREFEWKSMDGKPVDMAEQMVFTVVMKKPLRAKILPRRNKC